MRHKVVLVADDDPSILESLQAGMEVEGWQSHAVFNGHEAIKFVHERNPDMVILSTNMPGMSGVDVCRHVSAISEIPVIMLAARHDPEERALCFSLGADDYINKPFQPQDLINRVKGTLLKRKVMGTKDYDPIRCLQECIDGLRAKIEKDPENPEYIVTVPGIGYRFDIPGNTRSEGKSGG